jgi:aminoglycoside phosphotransferase (APT) family kinase protein
MLDNEYKVLSSINVQKISSPCIYEKYEDNEYSWLLMEFIKGETLRNAIRESTSSQRHKMLVNYGKMLWQIHSQKIEINNNDDAWIERKLREAQYNLDNYRIEGTVGKLNYLKNNKPSMIKEVFIHGDYTIDNVMFYGGEVSGVIDWGGGTIGDPRYDVALAIRPKDGVFQNSEDVEYFYEGYGGNRITKKEFDYFQSGGLYDFF